MSYWEDSVAELEKYWQLLKKAEKRFKKLAYYARWGIVISALILLMLMTYGGLK